MKKILNVFNNINLFFSSEFANKSAIDGNVLSLLLYKLAYPSAKIFSLLSIKPNLITWLSFFFTCLAVFFLYKESSSFYFVIFWLISLHLDFADGTLARMTKKISNNAFRLDHMTDLIKLFIVFVGIGLFYNLFITWILVCASIFALMYSEILSHEIKHYSRRAIENKSDFNETRLIDSKLINEQLLLRFKLVINILRNIYSIFFSISGHTLLFFCIIPFSVIYANIFLFYFTILSFYGIIRAVITLSSFKK